MHELMFDDCWIVCWLVCEKFIFCTLEIYKQDVKFNILKSLRNALTPVQDEIINNSIYMKWKERWKLKEKSYQTSNFPLEFNESFALFF